MIQTNSGLRSLVQSLRPITSSLSEIAAYSCYTSQAASALQQVSRPNSYSEDEYAKVDWDNLGFGITPVDYMYTMKCSSDGKFEQGQLAPYGNVHLSPSAAVLNYGQGLYEGTKAYRTEDGRLLLFRLDQNATRMKMGADRLCMACPSSYQFIDAVKQTALANKRWIPPRGKGTLYIRPLLMGSGAVLGLAPAPEYTFLVYASPVGNYFKEGLKPLNLCVEDEFHRATRGGAGGVKSITNYAPVLKAMARAKSRGFSDVLYLDSANKKNLEEVSSCNIFLVKGNIISTPATSGTILRGVTRRSIIEIALDHGYQPGTWIVRFQSIALRTRSEIHNVKLNQVEERAIPVDELMDADEVFCTGTAVGVAPVGSITYQDRRVEYNVGEESVSQKLYSILEGIKTGVIEDKKGWTIKI
ncbi:branched-chain-amino-acid aminotransferase 2 [Populus alba x Populus x berolinensis]|nr:branched-chain-amino-acid aminotransferase 2 [Populus alba x Populus x berolinensis]